MNLHSSYAWMVLAMTLTSAKPFTPPQEKPPFPIHPVAAPHQPLNNQIWAIPHQWLGKRVVQEQHGAHEKRDASATTTDTTSVLIWTPTTPVILAPEAPINASEANMLYKSNGPDCGVDVFDNGTKTDWGCESGGCCSKFGYCGKTFKHCGFGCQHSGCQRFGV
ncbi:Hypothetical protein R9X50_00124700 [Acrodontium crateriforme]|uniref:Chitin-binding type-1 domain-containing protein n=1 Tax=Acrodontium crateriforme TaxID=150365 RepID=A0AAQ3M4T3_9PEZI|nr:Hypothetical protein R9X50_00124700 [Acrodontium crateriforme]